MKRLLILLALLVCACDPPQDDKTLPAGLTRTCYAKTGEQYQYEAVVFGDVTTTKTVTLLSRFTFTPDGSGIRYVYYQTLLPDMTTTENKQYAHLSFTWRAQGNTIYIEAETDPILPASVTLADIQASGTNWSASYNGKAITIFRYENGIEI